MKLTTLGGSAAGVGTGQGCSSYLVRAAATSLVIDMGPNTLLELRKHVDYRQLDGIVISHLHADHILDLVALRYMLNYNPVSARGLIPLHLPPDGIATLERIAAAYEGSGTGIEWFTSAFDVREYDPAQSVAVGAFSCTFAPTVHYIPCWAIRVHPSDDSGDLLYTADTGPAADLDGFGRGVHVLLAEGTARENNDEPYDTRGHLTPAEAGELAARIGAHTLVLTHLWEENDPADSIQQATTAFNGDVIRTTPGMEIAWRR